MLPNEVHSGGIIWGSRDEKSLNECRSCRFTGGNNSRNPLRTQELSIVGRVDPDKALMNFGVFVLQKARIYITLYMNKAYPFAPIPTPKIPTKHIGFIKQHLHNVRLQ